MSGYQFIHIESYAKIPSRSKKKQSARNVAREAERAPDACPHIESPQPYKKMYGMTPSQAVDLAEERALKAKDSCGRKLRKDAQILLGGVVSYPVPMSQLSPDDPDLKKWLKHNFDFLILNYGDTLKSVDAHFDESYFHLHYYCVPDIDKNARMNIGQIHPGVLARDSIGGKQAKEKMRAYKKAMRDFQDSYYEAVGKPCGLTREGAKKRRLSRSEWKAEQAIAERLASSMKFIDFANNESLKLKEKREHLEVKEQKLKVLSASATEVAKQARTEREELILIKSNKVSIVKYLKSKVKILTEKIKSLLNKISFLERENEDMKEELSNLKKQNYNLFRINEKLTYQNSVKDAGLKKQRIEIYSIVNLIEKGKTNEIAGYYNKNKEKTL